jgi:putative two-component system response regulator
MCPSILLVDVSFSNRANWQSFLENQGYHVSTAEDGDTALRQCLFLLPDLVLVHDSPPEIDGFELCRRLKENPLNQLVPVVLIKSSSDSADASSGHRAGADDFWGNCTSLGEGLGRIQSLLRLKNYIDDQARAVVLSLARSIEAKNNLTETHSERMVGHAIQLGSTLGLREPELRDLRIACLLHDVGKVAIPDEILLKPGPLNAEELQVVKQHPIVGENICAPLKSLRQILPIIRHHHERMDGSGYPDGLLGEQIPVAARILQIADIYDALTTERAYRIALSSEHALEILRLETMNGWLDAFLVSAFARIIRSRDYASIGGRSMLASYFAPSRPPEHFGCPEEL